MGTKNTLIDLNDHLFMELERLGDEDMTSEQIKAECQRAKSISDISKNIIMNAKVVLEARKLEEHLGAPVKELPRFIQGDGDALKRSEWKPRPTLSGPSGRVSS